MLLESSWNRIVPYGIHSIYDFLTSRQTATWEGKPMIRTDQYTTFSGNVEYSEEI